MMGMEELELEQASTELKDFFKVTQANVLVEAQYKLTLEEKRLVLSAISLINPRMDVPREITIAAKEYAKIFNIKVQVAYVQLKDASNRLYERDIRFKEDSDTEGRQRWVDRVTYNKKQGSVTLSFSSHLHPHLARLNKGGFTSYALANIGPLKSIYSVRIFELLSQYRSERSRFISVQNFRAMFELEDKYSLFSALRRNVIEPAIAEINKKTMLDVTFAVEKRGKTVVKLWFHFSEKRQLQLPDLLTD